MLSPAHDIALHLAANSVGTFGGGFKWSIAVGNEPLSPPECITIYDTGGNPPDTGELDILEPFFQVRVRGPSYPEAYTKHENIRDILTANDPVQTANSSFIGIAMQSDILTLGRNEGNLFILTANYRALRRKGA